ncbi:MAG TPA: Ig-like domain-containing protein [Kofleriaceae bacterium]|nr:Ig-like domain-containing protein [Kofleriaceae bacterium]
MVHADVARTVDPTQGGSIDEDTTPAPLVSRPVSERVMVELAPADILPAVNTNVIFLNSCRPNGCVVRVGSANSINDTWPISSTRTLTPFHLGETQWQQVMSCMRDVFGPFGVQITDVDPGTANHFEIMIAGSPTDLGMSSGTGGVSPFNCQAEFISNSLVFDFSKVWGSDIEEICSTAAQEIAHSFRLDHVTDPSDPLTYFPFNGRRRFVDAQVQCGSDCVGGQGPFGQTCSGTNQQNHSCTCTGSQTQNSVQVIRNLFGAGTPTPPSVKILNPKTGDNVAPGFPVSADVTDDQMVTKAELRVDGQLVLSLATPPYAFNAPATLGNGTHTVEVTGYDTYGATAKATVQVIIGDPCTKPADCPLDTDTCIGGRCVPGPGVQGGLGTSCTAPDQCASGLCAGDASGQYCVEVCALGEGQCPDGFGCAEDGAGGGICFPGYDDGTGGCSSGGSGGAIGMGLGFAAILVLRRRKRS